MGFARLRTIAISPLSPRPYQVTFHELAHVVLGHTTEGLQADSPSTPRNLRECEAEAVALICCAALNLPGDRKTWATYGLEGAERADLSWLTAVVNSRLSGPISAQVDLDASSKSFELRLVPNSLLQAMWLQFAESMTTGAEFRPCSVCGEWFLVSRTEGGRRKRRTYCGNACKLWAFRHQLKPAGNAEVVDPEGTQRRRRRRPRINS